MQNANTEQNVKTEKEIRNEIYNGTMQQVLKNHYSILKAINLNQPVQTGGNSQDSEFPKGFEYIDIDSFLNDDINKS